MRLSRLLMPPDLEGREGENQRQQGHYTGVGTMPSSWPPREAADDRARRHDQHEAGFSPRRRNFDPDITGEPDHIVGKLTASERLPASLISAAEQQKSVGISNSPPATPRSAATMPMTNPAATPTTICARTIIAAEIAPVMAKDKKARD